MRFKYKVKNKAGEIISGEKDVQDKYTLFKELHSAGDELISFEECSSGGKDIRDIFPFLGNLTGRIKIHEKIIFARNLGSMIEAGLSLSRALNVLIRQSKNKKLVAVLTAVNESVSQGKTLSDSMKMYPKIFSSLFVSMVMAGEQSGSLAESLKVVALQMDKNYTLQRKIKGAMVYPCVILVVMVAIAILMLLFIVPTLTATFREMNVDLPLSTQMIIKMSDLIRNQYILVMAILIPILVGIVAFFRTAKGKKVLDYSFIKAPVAGEIVKQVNSARTARTLSSLISAGVDVLEALKITEEVLQNSYYKKVLNDSRTTVQKGEPISKIFLDNSNLFPVFVGEMMSVGEETGKIGEMLKGVAQFYEEEVDQKTKDMSSIIEPVLMVFIGIGVGFFAIAMIMPMYSLSSKI